MTNVAGAHAEVWIVEVCAVSGSLMKREVYADPDAAGDSEKAAQWWLSQAQVVHRWVM